MMIQKPFIRKFEGDSGEKYVYCANTNRILKVEHIIYEVIDYLFFECDEIIINRLGKRYAKDEIHNALKVLRAFNRETGFAAAKRPQKMKIRLNKDEYEHKLQNGLWGINLNLTNGCNLKCKYCLYNKSFYFKRKKTPEFMSPDVAKRAIEFFIASSSDEKELHLGYYGGEPFMNYSVMKGSLDYIKELNKKRNNRKLHVHITSNGTLLNSERIKWLIDNDIKILISLDGPKSIHDRYRIQKNDRGSFDLILKALKAIKSFSKEYYDQKVTMNMVLAPPYELEGLCDFILNSAYASNRILASVLLPDKDGYFVNIEKRLQMTFREFQCRALDNYFNYVRKDVKNINKYAMLLSLSKIPLYNYARRGKYNCSEDFIDIPMCEIGIGRGFILTDGSFYPCERIPQYKYLELGNIYEGIYKSTDNNTQAWNILEKYFRLLDDRCCDCWAYRLCSIKSCIKFGSSSRQLSKSKLKNQCDTMKRHIQNDLKCYLSAEGKYPEIMNKLFEMA